MQIDDVNKEWAGFEPNCDNRWVLGPCKDGQMIQRRSYKVKIDYILEKPLFHHSTIPVFHEWSYKFRSQITPYIPSNL